MKRLALALLSLCLSASLVAADRPWTLTEAAAAPKKTKMVLRGTVERAINFDYFILADDGGRVLLNAAGVRQRLAAGDVVLVWGRTLGRTDRYSRTLTEIEAKEIANDGTPEGAKLLTTHLAEIAAPARPADAGTSAVPPPPPPDVPPAAPSVEARLKTLEDLKSRGLVTDDEYRDQRKRILDDL